MPKRIEPAIKRMERLEARLLVFQQKAKALREQIERLKLPSKKRTKIKVASGKVNACP
jgi:hypothetical protein